MSFDLDDKQHRPVREIAPPPFDGGVKRGDGGTGFDSKVFRDSAYGETAITNYVNVSRVWGVDVVI